MRAPPTAPPGGIPPEFLTPAFTSPDQLDPRNGGLAALPPAVTALEQLTYLDLADDVFGAPDSLEGLQQLSNLR